MTAGNLVLSAPPLVMGVLKLGAAHQSEQPVLTIDQALHKAEQMLAAGAALIDVYCEVASEGASTISVQQELDSVVPVIELISKRISIPISICSSTPEVMSAAVNAGARMINDVHALSKINALHTAVKLQQPVCLMHMHSDPVNQQLSSVDKDIVSVVYKYLQSRIEACVAAGIDKSKLLIDPGFGFGKNLAQNLSILRSLHVFKNLQCPILVDIAHKSMLGQILNVDQDQRVYGSIAAEVIAISKGADIIRSHDVRATVDAIKVIKAVASE